MLQKDVALLLNVSTKTVVNWELGKCDPHLELLPHIMAFLGYCPYEIAPTLGKRLRAIRQKLLGTLQGEMAVLIGIDPTTLSRIEGRGVRASRAVAEKIERYLETLR